MSPYKLKVVSDFKIQIEHTIPIFSYNKNYTKVIDTLKLKSKYRINPNEIRHSNELPTYHLIPIKDRFLQILSQNWKIKKKNILFQKNYELLKLDGHILSGIYSGIIFDDESWSRDWELTKLLKNDV